MVNLQEFSNVAQLAVLIGGLMQLCVSWPRGSCVPPAWVPYYVVCIGCGLAIVVGLSLDQVHALPDALAWAVGGFQASLLAIASHGTAGRVAKRAKKKEKEE